jgi:uncharacterized OB-fold protein
MKSKKRPSRLPEEWEMVKDCPEPIVSQQDFDTVQRLVTSRRNKGRSGLGNIFSGLIKCADCGYAMTANSANRHKRKELIDCIVYSCNNYTQYGSGSCSAHSIETRDLYDAVLADINAQAATVMADDGMARALQRRLATMTERQEAGKEKERRKLAKRLSELDRLFASLYEDRAAGQISPRNYEQMRTRYEEEQEEEAVKLAGVDAELAAKGEAEQGVSDFVSLIKDYSDLTELSAAVLNALIERIDVAERVKAEDGATTRHITIHYRFVGTLGECELAVPKRESQLEDKTCERCGSVFSPSSSLSKYCHECRDAKRREWAAADNDKKREKRQAHRAANPLPESVYNAKPCSHCGSVYTPRSGNSKYCPECRSEVSRVHLNHGS